MGLMYNIKANFEDWAKCFYSIFYEEKIYLNLRQELQKNLIKSNAHAYRVEWLIKSTKRAYILPSDKDNGD